MSYARRKKIEEVFDIAYPSAEMVGGQAKKKRRVELASMNRTMSFAALVFLVYIWMKGGPGVDPVLNKGITIFLLAILIPVSYSFCSISSALLGPRSAPERTLAASTGFFAAWGLFGLFVDEFSLRPNDPYKMYIIAAMVLVWFISSLIPYPERDDNGSFTSPRTRRILKSIFYFIFISMVMMGLSNPSDRGHYAFTEGVYLLSLIPFIIVTLKAGWIIFPMPTFYYGPNILMGVGAFVVWISGYGKSTGYQPILFVGCCAAIIMMIIYGYGRHSYVQRGIQPY